MDLNHCLPVLFVRNIEISKDFYINILGFHIELDFGKNITLSEGISIWEIRDTHIIPSTLGTARITNSESNRFHAAGNINKFFPFLDRHAVAGKESLKS